ncbi:MULTISPECIES: DUF1737 domain-containing protein [Stutzerimonas stutzeri subgroup]|uniref:DUF1737 domain-containing protein n=2 Tax=Stutzerimonas stutzeri subgroup TaxID=578833 RepID=A0A2N8SC72_9GAMM|nr:MULTISPECIES: DUF1737 domain-containing protein [Stutzerimonas stutzeri subgroup]AFM32289.1 hypothetical protein A458_05205 [Stutzerimonas stutzeri CCUG 29243]MCD1606613.1 DUF1737 domain-containing protein [Stutzerimonas kunmingensis]MCQ2039330.1 DUF1737 domain-containing protein [Stutzerimonas kunmingensis]MCQ2044059.1 DUF1737 domain-containing protein [Stutzerimonas kunmingensis]PNG00077.1 DUF1737 domain-containing protein [Stutzerimonas kunmingensis]
MKLYRFVTGPDDVLFCMRITESLNNGWELHGGPTLTFDGKTPIAGQALIKEVPGEKFSSDIDLKSY